MKRYIALLRGINISGKNKVPMAELKTGFEKLAFEEVKTFLNSGNVIFSAKEKDTKKLAKQIEGMIQEEFDIRIPVLVIIKEELADILQNAPDWWGKDSQEIYDNLIFVIPPAAVTEIYEQIGEPNKELEKIECYKEVIFWSFSRKDYQKTKWWPKTASAEIGMKLTIRTANTVRKIVNM